METEAFILPACVCVCIVHCRPPGRLGYTSLGTRISLCVTWLHYLQSDCGWNVTNIVFINSTGAFASLGSLCGTTSGTADSAFTERPPHYPSPALRPVFILSVRISDSETAISFINFGCNKRAKCLWMSLSFYLCVDGLWMTTTLRRTFVCHLCIMFTITDGSCVCFKWSIAKGYKVM